MSAPRTLLVTGAASNSGRHFRRRFAREGWTVVPTDRRADPADPDLRPADITSRGELRSLVHDTRPDAVLHLAGAAGPDADTCWTVNLEGTRALVRAVRDEERPPLVVFVSSSAVYGAGDPPERPLVESDPLRPLGAYGASKAAAEEELHGHNEDGAIRLVVARPFNLVGPGLRRGLAPADFLEQVLAIRAGERDAVIETGDLSPARDYVDVRDAVDAYAALLERPDLAGGVFNVASGRAVRIADVLEGLLRAAGVEARVEETRPARKGDLPIQVGNPAALAEAAEWAADTPLERSLADMVEQAQV